MARHGQYVLRFFFEWGGGCLWPGNDAVTRDFGYGPLEMPDTKLPLSAATINRCTEIAEWHDTSLNRDYPPDPGPWRQAECNQFNAAVKQLLADIREELGEEFDVVNQQDETVEDSDLDAYLADRKRFRRSQL